MLTVDDHPSARPVAFTTTFPGALGELGPADEIVGLLSLEAEAPFRPTDDVKLAVRNMLRHGGYKPAGRGKPASEYLVRAAGEGKLGSINPAVDVCNVVSLHSGLPISVVDLDRARPPFRIGLGSAGESYVFNASGQEIRVEGLLCLHDAEGPCGNGVKDSHRTKTSDATVRTLSVIWGASDLQELTTRVVVWYRELLELFGATTGAV